jgi:hypothetical protein
MTLFGHTESQQLAFLGLVRLNRSAAFENWHVLLKPGGESEFDGERFEPTAARLEFFLLRRSEGETFFIMESMSSVVGLGTGYFHSTLTEALQ